MLSINWLQAIGWHGPRTGGASRRREAPHDALFLLAGARQDRGDISGTVAAAALLPHDAERAIAKHSHDVTAAPG
eukprot:scaffold177799_cov30-Tisochrysis_lutea.AAC.3